MPTLAFMIMISTGKGNETNPWLSVPMYKYVYAFTVMSICSTYSPPEAYENINTTGSLKPSLVVTLKGTVTAHKETCDD